MVRIPQSNFMKHTILHIRFATPAAHVGETAASKEGKVDILVSMSCWTRGEKKWKINHKKINMLIYKILNYLYLARACGHVNHSACHAAAHYTSVLHTLSNRKQSIIDRGWVVKIDGCASDI